MLLPPPYPPPPPCVRSTRSSHVRGPPIKGRAYTHARNVARAESVSRGGSEHRGERKAGARRCAAELDRGQCTCDNNNNSTPQVERRRRGRGVAGVAEEGRRRPRVRGLFAPRAIARAIQTAIVDAAI